MDHDGGECGPVNARVVPHGRGYSPPGPPRHFRGERVVGTDPRLLVVRGERDAGHCPPPGRGRLLAAVCTPHDRSVSGGDILRPPPRASGDDLVPTDTPPTAGAGAGADARSRSAKLLEARRDEGVAGSPR